MVDYLAAMPSGRVLGKGVDSHGCRVGEQSGEVYDKRSMSKGEARTRMASLREWYKHKGMRGRE